MSPHRPPWKPEWPGFSPAGSVILPLPAPPFADRESTFRVDALELQLKHEFHVTLLNRAQGKRAQAKPIPGGTAAAALPALFAELDWQWRATGLRWLLREDLEGKPVKHSVIELLEMPAFNAFRRRAQDLLQEPVPPAPAHVTLYVAGNAGGIGLDDDGEFLRLRVMPLA